VLSVAGGVARAIRSNDELRVADAAAAVAADEDDDDDDDEEEDFLLVDEPCVMPLVLVPPLIAELELELDVVLVVDVDEQRDTIDGEHTLCDDPCHVSGLVIVTESIAGTTRLEDDSSDDGDDVEVAEAAAERGSLASRVCSRLSPRLRASTAATCGSCSICRGSTGVSQPSMATLIGVTRRSFSTTLMMFLITAAASAGSPGFTGRGRIVLDVLAERNQLLFNV